MHMLGWIIKHWGWLVAGALLLAYAALYVLAVREQRATGDGKPRLPCDRC